jgi:outer membrane biosynthesis protein TonB
MSLNTFGERRMSRTKTFLAGWKGVALLSGLLLVLVLVLAGCGGEPPAVPAEPTEVVAAPTEPLAPTDVPTEALTPTDVPTEPPTPTDVPTEPPPTHTPAPTEEPTPEVVDDTGCITCHTDEEILKSLAKEPEEAESLSEGEG